MFVIGLEYIILLVVIGIEIYKKKLGLFRKIPIES